MTKKCFIHKEIDINEMWTFVLNEARRRGREIAIQKGHFCENALAITIIVDEGRAKSSISILIMKNLLRLKSLAKKTRKLLYIGVVTSSVCFHQKIFYKLKDCIGCFIQQVSLERPISF